MVGAGVVFVGGEQQEKSEEKRERGKQCGRRREGEMQQKNGKGAANARIDHTKGETK